MAVVKRTKVVAKKANGVKPEVKSKAKTKIEEDIDDEDVDVDDVDEEEDEEEEASKSKKPVKKSTKKPVVEDEDDEEEDEEEEAEAEDDEEEEDDVDEDDEEEDEEEEAPKSKKVTSKKTVTKKSTSDKSSKKEAPKSKKAEKKAPKVEKPEVPELDTMKRDDIIALVKANLEEQGVTCETKAEAERIIKAVESAFMESLNNLNKCTFGGKNFNRSKINGRVYAPVLEQSNGVATYIPPHYKMSMVVEPKDTIKGSIKKDTFVSEDGKTKFKLSEIDKINEKFFN